MQDRTQIVAEIADEVISRLLAHLDGGGAPRPATPPAPEAKPAPKRKPAPTGHGVFATVDEAVRAAAKAQPVVAAMSLEDRGRMFVSPGERVYEGMVIGIHSRDNDLIVNPVKGKKLTNVRAAGKDENVLLTPPIQLTLAGAVEFIDDDELVEVTPKNIRLRKRHLLEHDRKRAAREEQAA